MPFEGGKLEGVPAVARLLRIAEETLFKMIENGEIEAYRIGKRWKISQAGFEAYLARNSNKKPKVKSRRKSPVTSPVKEFV